MQIYLGMCVVRSLLSIFVLDRVILHAGCWLCSYILVVVWRCRSIDSVVITFVDKVVCRSLRLAERIDGFFQSRGDVSDGLVGELEVLFDRDRVLDLEEDDGEGEDESGS